MWAAGSGNGDTVRMLLARRADAALVDNRGKTALQMAVDSRRDEVVRLLQAPAAGMMNTVQGR